MNLLARLLDRHMLGIVRERILDDLFTATAAGFGVAEPPTIGRSYEERLAAYARFTRDEAERAIRDGADLAAIERRLRQEALALGQRTRRLLGVAGAAEALAVARPLYRAIGVDFHGDAAGEVTVSRCFFSDYYTPDVCRLISALDEGVLAGLAGGGRLVFTQRLTEGCDCCRARLTAEETSP